MTAAELLARDKTNIKIIGLLLDNARRTFSEIGKEVGISKNAVWNRYKEMTQAALITGATVQINYKKLGYDAVGTLLLDVDMQHIEQASKYIKAMVPDVFGPFSSASRYNLRAVVTLKNVSELGKIKDELQKKLATSEISSSLWTDIWFTPENLSLVPVQPIVISDKKTSNNRIFDADKLDFDIIKELAEDSRKSFRYMAKKMDVSVDTVSRRYEKLTEEGIIASRIQFDPRKIGYSGFAQFYLRIMPKYDVDAVISEIFPIPDVFYIMKCKGDYNISAMLMVKSIQDMVSTGDFIAGIKGIKRTETVASEITAKWPLPRTYASTLVRNLIIT